MFECVDNRVTQHREVRCNGKLIQEIPRERIDDPGVDEVRPRWGYYADTSTAADR
jgi:hypothetical protein